MNFLDILKRYATVLLFWGVLLPASVAFAEDTAAEIQQRIEQLQNEAAQTTDLNRLMDIAAELQELSIRMQQANNGVPAVPPVLGKTPDEEVNRQIQAINSSYEGQKKAFAGYRDANAPQVPFLSARKLHGSIEVHGSNQRQPSEPPYDGGIFRTLIYTIREDFVGYLVTAEYYDPKAGKFTDKRDYRITTISQKIHAPAFGGRECVERDSIDREACEKWEPYDSYRLGDGDTYPAIHDWTVMGTPEGEGILLELETPDVLFSTVANSRSRAQGCFGAEINLSNADFVQAIKDDKLAVQHSVGGTSAAPRTVVEGRQWHWISNSAKTCHVVNSWSPCFSTSFGPSICATCIEPNQRLPTAWITWTDW